MKARRHTLIAFLVAPVLFSWESALSAEEADKAAVAQSVPTAQPVSPSYAGDPKRTLESRRDALQRQRDDLLDWRSGRYWHQPPWVKAREGWMEEQRARTREAMRQRQSALEQWNDAVGRWRNPYGQWIEDMADARRTAVEARRLQAEAWYNRSMAQPWPGEGWGGGPWGGGYPWW